MVFRTVTRDGTTILDGGTPTSDSDNGWSPELAVVSDGERRVHQIVDWVGGEGTPPSSVNQFIGPTGIVGSAAAAVDIRGAAGGDGDDGDPGGPGPVHDMRGTSTDSELMAIGSKTFSLAAAMNAAFPVGTVVRASHDADPQQYMLGNVTAATTTSVTVNVVEMLGSGTYADWTIVVAGYSGIRHLWGAVGSLPGPYADGTVTDEY